MKQKPLDQHFQLENLSHGENDDLAPSLGGILAVLQYSTKEKEEEIKDWYQIINCKRLVTLKERDQALPG